jgi:hypothetical protein
VIGSNQSPGDAVASPPAEPSPAQPPELETPASVAVPTPAPPPRRLGFFRRIHEWFWQSRALAALRAEGRIGSPRAQELLRRGWACVELAERALRPVPALLSGPADAPARELAREAVYWALAAAEAREGAPMRVDDGVERSGAPSFVTLWSRADAALLASSAGGQGAITVLESALKLESFTDFGEFAREEQARQAYDLAVFARTLLANVEAPRVRADKIYFRRLLRTGGFFVLLCVLAAVGLSARAWHDRERDWARGKPYRTSSSYPGVGCKSPDQECAESPFFFFHTLEEDRPWIEIDLGTKRRFSTIRIVNREDCCGERAVPLAIEVSNDHKNWREIARREDTFNTWTKDFSPVSARYVRAINLKKGILHFKRFSVLR